MNSRTTTSQAGATIAPGELIPREALGYLEAIVGAGAFVDGAIDQPLDTLRIVA